MSDRVLWGGIDEAGYGPKLGPLVVAGASFGLPCPPREGILWNRLEEAVVQEPQGAGDRLLVNDSKEVYNTSGGYRRLEEGVLAFLEAAGDRPDRAGDLVEMLAPAPHSEGEPWFRGAAGLEIPFASNRSAVSSSVSTLERALEAGGVRVRGLWACVVLPCEFNRLVQKMGNKSLLLFHKAGLIMREMWNGSGSDGFLLVDRHGGRTHYRKLLRDVYPELACDVLAEETQRSVYGIGGSRGRLKVAFKKDGDSLALPTALASMTAKYVRELYMAAFNRYWQTRLEGLKPTAGYGQDAYRFLDDIEDLLDAEDIERDRLVRCR